MITETAVASLTTVHKGQVVSLKPEWQDAGDSEFTWIALEDDDGEMVMIVPLGTGLTFPPQYRVKLSWLES